MAALHEAVSAAEEGNFGAGAVIVDPDGEIVERGHNHVFHPHFRSDIHAEMDVLTKFEEGNPSLSSVGGYSLFTSLEPCPMCLTRLITAGIGHVHHAAADTESGMVSRLEQLTPVWVDLAKDQEFSLADCSDELRDLAIEVFLYTATTNTHRLLQRRRRMTATHVASRPQSLGRQLDGNVIRRGVSSAYHSVDPSTGSNTSSAPTSTAPTSVIA